MRVDNSGIQQAGQAYGQMFANLGKTIGSTIEKFREGKEKKEQQQRSEDLFLRLYETNSDNPIFSALSIQSTEEAKAVAKDISKDPKLVADAMKFAQMQMDQQKRDQATELYDRAVAADERKIADRQREVNFDRFMAGTGQPSKKAPALIVNPRQFQKRANEMGADPGLMNNRLMELQKQRIEASKGTGKTMNVFDPKLRQNVITLQNPDGTPGKVVALTPTQPKRIFTPEETRKINIDQTEDKQAMDTETLWRERAIDGQNTIQTVKSALSTLDKVGDTGGFNKYINAFKNYAASAGVEFSEEEMERLGQASKFEQLSGEFLFKAISQTKGAISNKEMQIFERISPGVVNTKRGNQLMLEYASKRAKRDVELNEYLAGLKANGMLPQERVLAGMKWLNDPENDITQGLSQLVPNQTQNSQSPAQTNRSGRRGSNPPPNPNAQTSGGFIIK